MSKSLAWALSVCVAASACGCSSNSDSPSGPSGNGGGTGSVLPAGGSASMSPLGGAAIAVGGSGGTGSGGSAAMAGSGASANTAGQSGGGGSAASAGSNSIPTDGNGPGTLEVEAGDPAADQEIHWTVSKGASALDAWAWVPGGISKLRGWILNVQFGNQYKELGRLTGFGLMAFDPQQYHDVADWDVELELQAAREAAAQLQHPELANAPFLATGHSIASGSGGLFLLHGAPSRLIGLAPGGMGYDYNRQEDAALKLAATQVPMLLFRGSRTNDSSDQIPGNLATNRALHGRMGFAIQWGAKHEFGLAGNIIVPMWWRSLIQRYPAGLMPGDAPVALRAVPEESGWLGSAAEWVPSPPDLTIEPHTVPEIAPFAQFSGDKSKAVWLLDSYMAHVWRAYQATDDTVHITYPPRMGEGGLALIESGGKLAVSVETGETPSPVSQLELYDGDLKLDFATQGQHEFQGVTLAPGVHALIAVVTMQNGKLLTSRPTVVMGIRGSCPTVASGGSVPITCIKP